MKNTLSMEKETSWQTYTPNQDRTHGFVIYGIVHDPELAEMNQEIEKYKVRVIIIYY